MSDADKGAALLRQIVAALSTPEGRSLARQARRLLERALDAGAGDGGATDHTDEIVSRVAARAVARARAKSLEIPRAARGRRRT